MISLVHFANCFLEKELCSTVSRDTAVAFTGEAPAQKASQLVSAIPKHKGSICVRPRACEKRHQSISEGCKRAKDASHEALDVRHNPAKQTARSIEHLNALEQALTSIAQQLEIQV